MRNQYYCVHTHRSHSGTYWIEFRAFKVALVIQNPPANAGDIGDVGSVPGDPLEKATHSSILT